MIKDLSTYKFFIILKALLLLMRLKNGLQG